MMPFAAEAPGLADQGRDAQATFRAILDAFARPGTIRSAPILDLPTDGVSVAAMAACLSLLDGDTRLWLTDTQRMRTLGRWLNFHTGVKLVQEPARASFALITDRQSMPALDGFDWGTDEEPERGATLIIEVEALAVGSGWHLRGPGIADVARLQVDGLSPAFVEQRRLMPGIFPRGVDVLFTCGPRLAALPRTTHLER
jgi:alpha-D-ribose 1-methylphosphonate 5-triphosphate synthase subunit PhnH